jgi:integrase
MKLTLSDLIIRKLKQGLYWDAATPAFGIRVGKRKKTFLVVKNGSKQALGHYPHLTLAKARQKASEGILEGSESLSTALSDFKRIHGSAVAERTMDDWDRLITKHFSSLLSKNLHDITMRDISKVLEEMKDTPQEANHAHAAISRLLNWCTSTGRLAHKLHIPTPYKKKSRERVLTLDEIKRVWITCSTNTPFHLIVRLLILTAQRRGEIANIHLCKIIAHAHTQTQLVRTADEIQQTRGKTDHNQCLESQNRELCHTMCAQHVTNAQPAGANTITPNIHLCTLNPTLLHTTSFTSLDVGKSEPLRHGSSTNSSSTNTITWNTTKNKKPHTIPLSTHSLTLSKELKMKLEYLGTAYTAWSKPKAALDKASGVSNWCLHDIRRSVATHLSKEIKVDYLTIEALLNHTPPGVRGIYNRDDRMDEMRDALERWEVFVLSLVNGRDST